jgi:putative ABC transport system substrate-binding protein
VNRRDFLPRFAALLIAIGTANAQQSAPRHIGVLLVGLSPDGKEAQEFREGLRDAGYVEGRDVVIEWRSANGDYDRVPGLVSDLIQRRMQVIVVENTFAAQALKRATINIPVVMAIIADPVGSDLVASLAHPGGNFTGFSLMLRELSAKRLQLLKEVLPQVVRVAVLSNPTVPWHGNVIGEIRKVAPPLGMELTFAAARLPAEIAAVFSAFTRSHVQALYVIEDPLFLVHRPMLFKLALSGKLPTIHGNRKYVESGGLMSYGASYADLMRRSAGYVDKLLKGAKPGDLPIEQPNKFDFVVNLKTAKALGITIPESILLRADEVIR